MNATTTTEIAQRPQQEAEPSARRGGIRIETMDDLVRFCRPLAESGYFKSARGVAQAIVAVEYGMELGIPPVAAVMNIHVIEGKPTMSSNMVAARIKASRKYNYRIRRLDDDACELDFFEDGEKIGDSVFTVEHAKAAGLLGKSNWKNYRRNMLLSRAMTNGARWHCPDLFLGGVYAAEEVASGAYDEAIDLDDIIEAQLNDVPEELDVQPPAAEPERRGVRVLTERQQVEMLSAAPDSKSSTTMRQEYYETWKGVDAKSRNLLGALLKAAGNEARGVPDVNEMSDDEQAALARAYELLDRAEADDEAKAKAE